MDFSPTDDQIALVDLATTIFTEQATPDRVKEVEASDERVDRALWGHLAQSGVLAAALPEAHGGAGFGFYEAALVFEAHGRCVDPIPLVPTLVAALTIAESATDEQQSAWLPRVASGDVFLATAITEAGNGDPLRPSTTALVDTNLDANTAGYRLNGTKYAVTGAHVAAALLVTAVLSDGTTGVFLVDADAVSAVEPEIGLNHEIAPTVTFTDTPAILIGAADGTAARMLVQRTLVGWAATAVGASAEAVQRTADYTSNRLQFGRPLSTNQGVMMECADAFIATEAMRVTVQNAAWRLAEGLDAAREVMVAKWWAADGGLRATHTALHLHGGMGADVDYPIHRYLLWCKHIASVLGGPQAQLARLGGVLAGAR